MLISAVALPATAAESTGTKAASEPTDAQATEPATESATENDLFSEAREDLEEIASTEETQDAAQANAEESEQTVDVAPEVVAQEEATQGAAIPAREAAEIAQTGIAPDLNVDVKAHRDKAYDNKIVLKWTALKDADGYRIYWCNLGKTGSPKKLLTTVKGKTTLTVNKLKQGDKYRFSVVPFSENEGKTEYGRSSNVTIATYPKPITTFQLKSNDTNATVIKWNRIYNIDGYLIMRMYQGKWSAYKYLSGSTTQFKDKKVKPGYAYYYKIMAYRRDTRGYVRSKPCTLKTVCGLSAPANDGTTSRANKAIFSWEKNRYATAYQLTYSLDNKKYKSLGNTAKTSYTTGKFKTGATVYLRVRPYRIVGKSKVKILGMTKVLKTKIVTSKFGSSVGDTYIEIDISDQHMWYIVDGDVYVSTPVVTGNYDSNDTPTGTFHINSKGRGVSLVGADYVSYVDYWMAFIGSSYGIHDASWRSSFGGDIFRGNGSHGCVNTPYDAVRKIYNHVDVGTAVVIHW